MFEFLIDTLEGEPLLGDLENVGACYPDDDVIYMFGIPCRLSSARPTKDALDLLPRPACCASFVLECDPAGDCQNFEAVEHSVQRICCTDCDTEVSEDDAACPKCGLRNPANR